ncbi:MAG: dTDP-glucose 4,6-dehydratase [Deltaproteobacteria bacterium]|nr:dTDP-glucose 4,6-dehydratase [Deltaproteobacteria bacterium]
MSTWIVTGGAGFIGSNFARRALAKTDARIVVVDKLTYAGNLQSLEDLADDPRFTFVHADITDRDAMDQLFTKEQPQVVVNFAAESHVDRSIEGPAEFVHTNVVGTLQLLEAARAHTAGLSSSEFDAFRFLQISTDEVYGSLGPEGLFREDTPFAPNSPYSASKAGADHLVRAYHETYGLPTLLTHCSNNYGPYQFPEKLIPLMILNALEAKPLPIYGDGLQIRDWLYVEDHCSALMRVLEAAAPGSHYNIGGRAEHTNLEIVDRLCAALEAAHPASENPALKSQGIDRYDALKTFVEDRPGHDRRYAIDDRRLREELDWSPSLDLETGMAKTVAWFLENREWCKAVQTGSYRRDRLGLLES